MWPEAKYTTASGRTVEIEGEFSSRDVGDWTYKTGKMEKPVWGVDTDRRKDGPQGKASPYYNHEVEGGYPGDRSSNGGKDGGPYEEMMDRPNTPSDLYKKQRDEINLKLAKANDAKKNPDREPDVVKSIEVTYHFETFWVCDGETKARVSWIWTSVWSMVTTRTEGTGRNRKVVNLPVKDWVLPDGSKDTIKIESIDNGQMSQEQKDAVNAIKAGTVR